MAPTPSFNDSGLARTADAFLARSKAITYHAKGWTISREAVAATPERLNVDADGFHGELRLSVWADGVLWFRLCRGSAKNGWDFILQFNGNAAQLQPEELVEQLLSSMSIAENESQLLAIWRDAAPEVERSEP